MSQYQSISHWGMFPVAVIAPYQTITCETVVYECGKIRLHTGLKACAISNGEGLMATDVPLSKKEYQLLEYFMKNQGVVIPVRQIMKNVWGPAYNEDSRQYLLVYLSKLRKKLGFDIIDNVTGHGYIMRRRDV